MREEAATACPAISQTCCMVTATHSIKALRHVGRFPWHPKQYCTSSICFLCASGYLNISFMGLKGEEVISKRAIMVYILQIMSP